MNRSNLIHIGTAGWTIPRELTDAVPGAGRHLERYSRVLSCCEINSSFHGPHKHATWERWAAAVPASFRFAVKAPKTITHAGTLDAHQPELRAFLTEISALGDKLGPVLFQLPPKLRFEPVSARSFFETVRQMHAGDIVLEPRHASWLAAEADELLATCRIARVAADPPRCAPHLEPGGFRGLTYFRLHGSPRVYYSSYSDEFLQTIAEKMRATSAPTWCIFDNTASGAAFGNALELRTLIAGDYAG